MNDKSEIEPDPIPASTDEEGGAVNRIDFGETVDFDWEDYFSLPDLGKDHYNLPDAALLGAIDAGLSGRISGCDPKIWSSYDTDEPEFRRAIAATQRSILELLVRCVGSGLLNAEVKARRPADSSAIPDRTYVAFPDLKECLDMHGFPPGDHFQKMFEDEASAMQEGAQSVAEERAEFRHGAAARPPTPPQGIKREELEPFWRSTARAQSLVIAELRSQLDGTRPKQPERELSTKERNTLLSIIAVLCQQAGLEPNRHAKTAAVLQHTADEMGINLGESTIESKLKAIPVALAGRMK